MTEKVHSPFCPVVVDRREPFYCACVHIEAALIDERDRIQAMLSMIIWNNKPPSDFPEIWAEPDPHPVTKSYVEGNNAVIWPD